MRVFEVRVSQQAVNIKFNTLFPLLAAIALTACPSNTDPVKDSVPVASAPIAAAPSASVSATPEPPPAPFASASVIAPAPPPAPLSIDPDTVTAVIAWQKDPKARGRYRSQWIERADDKPKVVNERPGAVFVSSSSLWTIETTIVKGCTQYAHNPDGSVFAINNIPQLARPDMEMPEITRISDGQRVAPWKDGHGYPYVGVQCDPAVEDYSVRIIFEGGMGPFVVTRMKNYTDGGGAHGITGENFFILNLETASTVKLSPREVDQAALIKKAAEGLGVEPKEVNPNGALLMYGPNGSGLAIYRYWGSSSYAGGSGGNSYSNDFEISSKSLPVEVSGYGKLPKWALPILKGKSIPVFMVPADRKDLFKLQFDAAYPKTK
jgi:hypothetical protein